MIESKLYNQMKILLNQFLDHHSLPSPRKRDELDQRLPALETRLARPTYEKSHDERLKISIICSTLFLQLDSY